MSRERVSLGEPGDRDLSGLPLLGLHPSQPVYRAHRADHSPWWYASGDGGRFNLPMPHGTCYLANDETAAIREVAGESLVNLGCVSAEFAAARVVSSLSVATTRTLADLADSGAARFGVTREISTCVPYSIPQAWARAIHGHQFDGIRYPARFSTGTGDLALAVFGAAGLHDDAVDATPQNFEEAAKECGIEVVRRPREVTTINPPQRQ